MSSAARAAAAAATRASEETARRAEEANQRTVAEVRLLATKAGEALGKAEEALQKAGEVAMKMLTEWEGVVIVLALVAAAIMISFGLLSLR